MQGAFLGPRFTTDEIRNALDEHGAVYEELGENELLARVAEVLMAEGVVVPPHTSYRAFIGSSIR